MISPNPIADGEALRIVIIGLSITSSWGNGHATTYRSLMRELVRRGHDVLFLEQNVPWFERHRDMPNPPLGRTVLYEDIEALRRWHAGDVGEADLVIVGSFVQNGVEVGDWVQSTAGGITAFYDIDTPVTMARLENAPPGAEIYLDARQIAGYDLYLSFTGGPILRRLERDYGARAARVLYCAADAEVYYPEHREPAWDLGYMGTYSEDRQPRVDAMLLAPARQWRSGRFNIAGAKYTAQETWPSNVSHFAHVPPSEHRAYYNAQRFTLNVTRDDMIAAGWSPSVRLFEAAACGTPIISDRWEGIETLLEPGREIFLAETPGEVLHLLRELPEEVRRATGERARARILAGHTSAIRAAQLQAYVSEARATALA